MEQLTEQQLQDCNNAGLGVALRMAMHQPVLTVGGEGRAIMAAAAKRLMELGDIRMANVLDTDTGLFERALRGAAPNEAEWQEANRELAEQVNDLGRKLDAANETNRCMTENYRELAAQSQAAAQTLTNLGYTYTDGAELWRPPLGNAPAFTRGHDGITITYDHCTGRTSGDPGDIDNVEWAHFSVRGTDGKTHGSCIHVVRRIAGKDGEEPNYAAIEARLLAHAPEAMPKRNDSAIIEDVTEICRDIARTWQGTLHTNGDNAESFRSGLETARNIWRIACKMHMEKTGEDGEAAAARENDLPF